jgi:succinate-acetate transporter protein
MKSLCEVSALGDALLMVAGGILGVICAVIAMTWLGWRKQ